MPSPPATSSPAPAWQWWRWWERLTRPAPSVTDLFRQVRARILAGIALGMIPAVLAHGVLRAVLVASPPSWLASAAPLAFLAAAAPSYVLARTRWFEWGAVLLVITGTAGPCLVGGLETSPPAIVVALTLSLVGVGIGGLLLPLAAAGLVAVATLLGVTFLAMTHPELDGATRAHAPVIIAFLEPVLFIASATVRRGLRSTAARARTLDALIDRSRVGVGTLRAGRLTAANPSFLQMLGSPPGEAVLGAPFGARLDADDRPRFEAATGEPVSVRVLGEDRAHRLLELTRIPDPAAEDHAAELVVARDLSGEPRLDDRMLLMNRLASLGTVAASVGHEINNPLTFVLFNLDFLRDELRDLLSGAAEPRRASEALRILADTRDGARRASQIVNELKAFGGALDEVADIEVEPVLRSALRVASTELRHRARVVEHILPVPPVRGSAARLGQVLLNLLVNAAQAIPRGAAEQNQVTVTTGTSDRGEVLISIADTGCGIPEELRSRVFEPFFTTKPPGQGTGLGLAICARIVRELGGEIGLESRLGAGSTFRVQLPAVTDAGPLPPAPQASSRGGQGRVLVVDDERPVADAIERLLRGYVVTQALDGDEALECCRRQRFDAIVCDLVMPRRSGWELYAALQAERPGQEERMIFVTAGAAMPAARTFLASVANPVLEKPFDPHALRSAVRDLCRRPGGPTTA